jgi:uncharacterized protein (UPF0335 family)
MGKIIFDESQIEALSQEEKAMFNSLKEKANATTDEGFDVKAYLEKRKKEEEEEEQFRKELEKNFV